MTMNRIRPLGNRVVIKRLDAKVTKGGIILPDSAQEKPKQGHVVAVGPGKLDDMGQLQKPSLKEGDLVLFSSYAGSPVKLKDDEEYLVMNEDEILGILS